MAKTINMECPICKKKVLFVGVHDDEGNYHGLVGCEYENDPWSGLSYALHHEGWGDCPMCTDGAYSTMGGMLFDTADDAISAMSLPNEPLTLEQLREMEGEPVWIVDVGPHKWYGPGWAIVDRDNCLVRTVKNWNPVFFEKYGERWLAYCRPPERQEDT